MNMTDLRNKPHLSASSINNYIDCGLKYRFSRVDRLVPEFRSDSLVFGSAMHMAIAGFHQERLTGNVLPLPELQGVFKSHWTEMANKKADIRYSKGKDFGTLLEDGQRLLQVYHENFPNDGLEVLAIEEPFSFTVDGLEVPVVGIYDLVERDSAGTIVVSDFKTTGHGYSNNEIGRSFQLTLYGLAAKVNGYRGREVLLRFDCIVKTKQPRFEQFYTARTQSDERRAVAKMQRVWDGISKQVFVPNDQSWKCTGCEYKRYCAELLEG